MHLISADVLSVCDSTIESDGIQNCLSEIDERYETMRIRATRWHTRFQQCLVGCEELRHNLNDLSAWVTSIHEQVSEITPVNLFSDERYLRAFYDRFKVILSGM